MACSYWFGYQPSGFVEFLVRYGNIPYLSIGWAIRRTQALSNQTKTICYLRTYNARIVARSTETPLNISVPHNLIDTVRREGSCRRTQEPTTCFRPIATSERVGKPVDSPDGTRDPANPRRRWQRESTSYSHADAGRFGHTGRTPASRDSQLFSKL